MHQNGYQNQQKRILRILLLSFIPLLFLIPERVEAQSTIQTQAFRLAEGFVRIAEPGQLADTLSVWGDVNSPGRYIVPRGTTFNELLSYARGPVNSYNAGQNIDWNKLRLDVIVSTYSKETGTEEFINFQIQYTSDFPPELRSLVLKNDDIVAVESKRQPGFLDYLRVFSTIVSAVATTIIVLDRISN